MAKPKDELQRQNKELLGLNDKLIKENAEIRKQNEELKKGIDLETKQELERAYTEIERLKKHIKWQSGRIERLENRNASKKHNERGAGRKSKIDTELENKVLALHKQGLSLRKISENVELSHTAASKIIKNFTKENRNKIEFVEEELKDIDGKKYKQLKL